MKERLKIILTGLGIIVFSILGLWEYMQMQIGYDVPQVVVVMPVAGLLAAALLGKFSFAVPVCTIAVSVVYQMAGSEEINQIVTNSKFNTILNILPYIIIFEMIGIAGGFLVRVLLKGRKSKAIGIVCCVLGVLLGFAGGVVMFGNPLYPFMARHALTSYAEKYDTENYKVSDVVVYYSMEEMEYQGRVVMSDGVIYALYHTKETGEVTEMQD